MVTMGSLGPFGPKRISGRVSQVNGLLSFCPVPSPTEQKESSDLKANALQCLWMETVTFLAV